MTSTEHTQRTNPQITLEHAMLVAKYGRKAEAVLLLRTVAAQQPVNQAAWLWLSAITPDQAEATAAFKQAQKINPTHPSLGKAEQWLVHRFSAAAPTRKVVAADTKPRFTPQKEERSLGNNKSWNLINFVAFGIAIVAIAIGLLVLVVGLIAEIRATAVAEERPVALDESPGFDQLQPGEEADTASRDLATDGFSPGEGSEQAQLVAGSHFRRQGPAEEALEAGSQQTIAQHSFDLVATYLAGSRHYQAGEWQLAIAELEKVWQENQEYPNVNDMLYSALYNHGLALQAKGDLLQAKEAFATAGNIRPDLDSPRQRIAEIESGAARDLAKTRPISIENRIIVVGIAEQRMEVYDGETLVYDFVVSTGEPGRDTAIGEFEILNKIDMAYASTWNLDMPFWMGIYWSGPLQNGIHSLPIVKHTGYKLWDGYLGQRVSYGCVILSDEDAATLYDWTEIGTKVKIVPSLAYWSLADEGEGS